MKEEKLNLKSDVDAKRAFKLLLEQKGFSNVKIVSSPSDIIAIKDGIKHFFEIKSTRQEEKYFGAATLTEWISAIDNPKNFKFVIAKKKDNSWEFTEYSPQEFLKFNTIPPFKTYFNLNLNQKIVKENNKKRKSLQLTEERLIKMKDFWISLRD